MPVSLGYIPEGEVLLEPRSPSAQLPSPPITPIQIQIPNNVAYPSNDEFAGVFMTTTNGPEPTLLSRTGTYNSKPSYEGPGGLIVRYIKMGFDGAWYYYGGGSEDAEHANSEPGDEAYPWLASWRYGATAQKAPSTSQKSSGNSQSTVTAVPYPTDEAQASADALVTLANKVGEEARIKMAEGILLRYLEGVAMGTLLFESAVSQKLFDMNVDKMSCSVAKMTSFTTSTNLKAYPKKYIELDWFSETMDGGQATEKFRRMYGSRLYTLGDKLTAYEGDTKIVFSIDNEDSEKKVYDLAQEASMNPDFGAEVVVKINPPYTIDQNEQRAIEAQKLQAIQTADSFISKNVGLIDSSQ